MTISRQKLTWLWGVYLALVAVSGATLAGYWAIGTLWDAPLLREMGLWFGLLVLAGSFPVPVAPKVRADLSAAGLFAVALLLEPGPAALVATAAVATHNYLARFWGDRYRYPWFKFPFNAGTAAVYAGMASWAFHALSAGTLMTPAVIAAAGIMYFLNSALVSLAVGLEGSRSPSVIWWTGTKSIGLGDLALYGLGFLGAVAYLQSPWAILALVVPLAVIYVAFRQLTRANQRLEDLQGQLATGSKLASVGAISLDMAHQILNPLTILVAHLEEMAESDSLDPALKFRVEAAGRASQRIQEIVQNLVVLGRHEPVTFELRNLLTEAYGIANLGRRTIVNADWAFADPAVRVSGNPVLLREAFTNLFANAMDALGAVAEGGVIGIKATQADHVVLVHVSDNGPGIPDTIKEHLLNPSGPLNQVAQGLGSLLRSISWSPWAARSRYWMSRGKALRSKSLCQLFLCQRMPPQRSIFDEAAARRCCR